MAFRIWNGTNGSWTTANNWFPPGVPGTGDTVQIPAGLVDANSVNTSGDTIFVDAIRSNVATGLSIDFTSLGVGSTTYLVGFGNVAFLTLIDASTDGILVDSYGPSEVTIPVGTTSVNHGWWAIASTTNSSVTTVANGTFNNEGAIETGPHALYTLAMTQNETNYGVFQVDPGGGMMFLSGDNTPSTFDTLVNLGHLFVNGGAMFVSANVSQLATGTTSINGGSLTLAGKFDGGTIQINSGTLNFLPTQFAPGPYAASELTSSIAFTGQTGEIDLGEAVTAAYRPATNDILVTAPYQGGQVQVADFQLTGAYTANEFTFGSNGQIYFHHS